MIRYTYIILLGLLGCFINKSNQLHTYVHHLTSAMGSIFIRTEQYKTMITSRKRFMYNINVEMNFFQVLIKYLTAIQLLSNVIAYRPVVIFHGILSGSESMMSLQRFIESQHPGTKVYNCDLFSNWYSLENAWKQISQFKDYLEEIQKLHPEGIIVLGYSQGGLLARATIQSMPNHNVKTFISLSSPQAGQYGTSFLHLIFPDLAAKTAFELFYSKVGQHTSVGNYWNDPNKQDLYLKYSVFLPYINNELRSTNSSDFKNALTRLDKMVLIGGPNDGVITPWESSHFGFYNGSLDVIPLNKRKIYTRDTIGLKTLADHGKLIIVVRPFVHHLTWHTNKHIIKEVILPHLN